jgi:hypothetical protein
MENILGIDLGLAIYHQPSLNSPRSTSVVRDSSWQGLEGSRVIVWVRCKTAKLATIDHTDLIT